MLVCVCDAALDVCCSCVVVPNGTSGLSFIVKETGIIVVDAKESAMRRNKKRATVGLESNIPENDTGNGHNWQIVLRCFARRHSFWKKASGEQCELGFLYLCIRSEPDK